MKNYDDELVLRSALIYSMKYHLPVFPSSKQKIPLIEDWYNRSSREPQIIKEWWNRWPDANVSIPTGSKSGLIVLDIDVKNGQPGFDSVGELEKKHGLLPKTPTSLSPSGGQHFFFKYNGPPLGRRIKFMPGLDLMAEDSQILLPPSIGVNGKKYMWEVSGRINEVDFAPPPDWLIKLVAPVLSSVDGVKNTKIPSSYWKMIAKHGAIEGRRNASVAQFAGYLLRHYLEPFLVLELMLLWNQFRNSPPLPNKEVIDTVNSIAGKEVRRRQGGGK